MSDYDPERDLDLDLTPPPVGAQYHPAETEDVLLHLRDIIEAARPVPLSASSMIAKDEVLELIDEALERLPEELRAARWLLKEREEFLARTRHEADEIVEQARARAERMVQRTEVVKAAEHRAYGIVDAAEADARRLRHEVEDFCDQKLASFEIVLERTQKLVAAGRSKLQGTNLLEEAAETPPLGSAGADRRVPDDDLRAGPSTLGIDDADDAEHAEDDENAEAGAVDDELSAARAARRSADDHSALPPPPSGAKDRDDAEATFFDQDLS